MMKKYINNIILVSLLVSLITSCDNYLDTESKSTFSEETAFKNLDFATKTVLGVYANFSVTSSMYDYAFFFYACDNDIERVHGTTSVLNSIARYNTNDGANYLLTTWRAIYQSIERANICIDQLPKSPIWEGEFEKEARSLYAEVITLRALCYFELIRHWGDVPFSIKSVQDGDNYFLQRTDRDEIYEYLIEELGEVQEYIPWMREINSTERINKGFVKGLRARMALAYAGYSRRNATETRRGRNWQEYYTIANEECKEIMESGQHTLNPNFETFFRSMHAYKQDMEYGESLFEIAFGRLQSGRVAQTMGMAFSTNPAEPKYGRAGGSIYTTPYYFYSFDNKDLRRNTTCELYDYSNSNYLSQQRLITTPGSFRISKWRRNWITPSMGGEYKESNYTGVNWPIMRYSDVVLMFAESENEINDGPTQEAEYALMSVRKRAFPEELWSQKVTAYVDSVSTDKASFFNAIVNERAWEFGGENIRKYDLIRWNLLGEKLRTVKEENRKIINNDTEWQHVPDYLFWKYASDQENVIILNQDERLSATNISGYTRTSWLSRISESAKVTFNTVIDRIGEGYDETTNNHLMPIGAAIITESNGVLSNDNY